MKTLTIRMPEELHKQFKIKCVSESVDMGTVVITLIEGYVKGSEPKKAKK